jgi:hypothetical protein
VNPNLHIPPNRSGMATAQFDSAMRHLRRNLYSCINFGPRDAAYMQDNANEVIKEVHFEYTTERGEEKGLMHSHAMIKILHYSQIQLFDTRKRVNRSNRTSIQKLFRDGFNAGVSETSSLHLQHDPFVSVKLLPQADSAKIMTNYILKGVRYSPIVAD